MTLNELSERLNMPPRMIRYLMAEGVMPPATKGGGRAADAYADEHLAAGERFKSLNESGLGVRAIAAMLEDERSLLIRASGVEMKVFDEAALASASDDEITTLVRAVRKAINERRKHKEGA